jgi:hypothetical protein
VLRATDRKTSRLIAPSLARDFLLVFAWSSPLVSVIADNDIGYDVIRINGLEDPQ